jgi:hypothetical protein
VVKDMAHHLREVPTHKELKLWIRVPKTKIDIKKENPVNKLFNSWSEQQKLIFLAGVFEGEDWKDEFILLVLSSPLFLLAYSVFAEDEEIGQKLDLYFEKLQTMPWWIISLWVAVVGAVYGIKATELKHMGGKK